MSKSVSMLRHCANLSTKIKDMSLINIEMNWKPGAERPVCKLQRPTQYWYIDHTHLDLAK